MIILGLIGEKGSGKQTFVNFTKKMLPNKSIRQVRLSDILSQTLMIWDLPITRENLQKLATVMNDSFGQASLANAARFSIEGDTSDIVIFDGIRTQEELGFVKKMPNSLLIYITADQDLRYERLRRRSEKIGEQGMSRVQFDIEEKSPRETQIPTLGKLADLALTNNSTLNEFSQSISHYLHSAILKP